ncbi:MAG: hypothetical protein ABID54_05570, partial [Pseudomonadota bacterium]
MAEEDFQKWYKGWASKIGLNPSPDDPRHHYDYRAAYRAGVEPTISSEDNKYHWPSQFKAPDHPNRYVGGMDTIMGKSTDLSQVIEALRRADKAGNVEDAKKLAVIANRLKNPSKEKERSLGPMPFVNRGIASGLGGPIDLITGGLNLIPSVDIQEPIGGSKSIERGMRGIGIDLPEEGQQPKTIHEYAGGSLGEVAGLIIPGGVVTKGLARSTGIVANISKSILASMGKHPFLTVASEAGGGLGAGTGRGIAEREMEIKDPGLQGMAEIAGGVAGGMIPSLYSAVSPTRWAIRGGKTLLRKLSVPFTKGGAKYRAGEYLKEQVADPSKIAQELEGQTIGDLPGTIQSGERRLMALYQSLIGQDPISNAETIETISKSIISLESEMRKLGYGSPEVLAEITKKRVAAIELKMNSRIVNAMDKAQQKLEAIPVAQRKVAESRIVRSELESIMNHEQDEVKKLWTEVPKDFEVGFSKTRETYRSLVADLADAQKVDIPWVLKRDPILTNDKLQSTTLKEMQGLRSKLLETARQARKDGKWNKARIADDMADAIIEDLGISAEGATTPEAASLQAALASTREFKTRFEQGIVGKILGFAKSGAPAISPELTLDISIGRMGGRGSVDISKVVVTPEARSATERYLARSFTDYAAEKGTINPIKAERWVKNNDAILDQFPQLRTKMTDAT